MTRDLDFFKAIRASSASSPYADCFLPREAQPPLGNLRPQYCVEWIQVERTAAVVLVCKVETSLPSINLILQARSRWSE